MGKQWKQWKTILGGSKITAAVGWSHETKCCFFFGRKAITNLDSIFGEGNGNPLQYSCLENPVGRGAWWAAVYGVTQSRTQLKRLSSSSRQHIKKQRHYFTHKGLSSQSYGFYSSHVRMLELDLKESWALKNWCFWTVVLEKTLESPMDCKEIQPVNPNRNQSWIFIGRNDAEAEAPILRPPDVKYWLTGKELDAGKNRRQKKGTTEDETVGWHLWLSGHLFGQTWGDSEGQGNLVSSSPWVHKELETTLQLNNKRLVNT